MAPLLDRATGVPERMDAPDVDPGALEEALDHIVAVNRWLGARRALIRHLDWALPGPGAVDPEGREGAPPGAADARAGGAVDAAARPPSGRPTRILDVGTGAGDLASVMARRARDRGRRVHVVGLDLHAATLAVARERVGAGVRLVRGDGLRLPFRTGAFDVVHMGMTLHHMDGEALTALLREAGRVARGGRILVGELERNVPHYLGARILAATVWRSNPVTRHDGPLSVLRAFTPAELLELARRATLRSPSVHRHPLYRLVLRAEAPDASP